jgi:hypothetical protein
MRNVQGYLKCHWTLPSGTYLLRIAPAAARATGKQTTINKYTYFAGHFDGHSNAPVQYHAYLLIEEVQGFTISHWTPLSGKYCGQQHKSEMATPVIYDVFHCQHVEKGRGLSQRPLFSIGVLHIKQKRRA